MSFYFRLDGTPYDDDPGVDDEPWLQWAKDFEDTRGRIIRQELLWNGLWVSTVWIGLASLSFSRRPLIFETMVFDHLTDGGDEVWGRWATLKEAEIGHREIVQKFSGVFNTFGRWFRQSMTTEEDLDL